MIDLNDLHPFGCFSEKCMDKQSEFNIKNTQYYKPGSEPEKCPVCGEDSLQELSKICLIKKVPSKGKIKASKWSQRYRKAKMFIYFCERSIDEHDIKNHIPIHTTIPACSNCPACLAEYNKLLELADGYLRTKE